MWPERDSIDALDNLWSVQGAMAAKKKSANPPEFPFKGNDGEKRRAAQRMAQLGLRQKNFQRDSVLPKAVAYAALEVALGKKRNYKTKQSYLDAFIKQKLSENLPDPLFYDASGEGAEPPDEYDPDVVLPRGMMFLNGYSDVRWHTPLAELQANSEGIEWEPIPDAEISKAQGTKLTRNEWENWATEFLLFASDLRQLLASETGRKRQLARARKQRQQPE